MSDLIERKDLGAAIDNWLAIDRYYHPYSKQKTIPVSELVDIIKLLPSAQRTGRWIDGKVKHIKNGELRNVRECSECGSSYFVYDYYNSVDEIPKFCPNCGCAMEGEEE